jgi:putative restriction endonuclease
VVKVKNKLWTREELLLAVNLYHKIPFGQFHQRNPSVIELASRMGRTPSAVAMKLVNFASLDPYHQNRGVVGLGNTSKADREIWYEVTNNWERFVDESEAYLEQLRQDQGIAQTSVDAIEDELSIPVGPTQVEQTVKVRRGQRFFRDTILASYQNRCCICGIPIRELLVASHIIPWSDNESLRLNPTNGLCLCALHDKGYDRGLLTISTEYKVVLSTKLEQYLPHDAVMNGFIIYDRLEIELPERFPPDKELLSLHNAHYFEA